jgi:hypothetical protein
MFSTPIGITYKLAVRDGYVEVPDGLLYRYAVPVDSAHMVPLSQVLTLIPGSKVTRESKNPSRISDELWIELPSFDRSQNPSPTDWYQVLRAAGKTATGYPMSPET